MNLGPAFTYFNEKPNTEDGVTIIDIPSKISSKSRIFEIYASKLPISDYFGHNWDALDEVLRDFSWEENRRIEIVHQDFPDLPKKEQKIYLEILKDAINYWKKEEMNSNDIKTHNLSVSFPLESKSCIEEFNF